MKICLFDAVRKFTQDLVNHWEKNGHTVVIDRYLDPGKVAWSDVTFFEFCDLSVQRGSDSGDHFYKEYPYSTDKNIIVRAHDIDLWVGHYRGVNWNWVNHLVFVGPYMHDHFLPMMNLPSSVKVHMIPHGINLEKFTYREKSVGNKIAWVGNINHAKNLELALQVLAENPEYELHVVGSGLGSWEEQYVSEFVKRNGLKFFHTPVVDDINQFLEDKDFVLLTSSKEAFSFIVGEGMSKGIKPLIHNFMGAEMIWPKEYIWNKVSEVGPMLKDEYNSLKYRQYIEEKYPLAKMLKEYDEIINNK